MMTAVSVSVGIVALIGAALLIVFGDMQWPIVIVALVLTGMAGLLNGTIGPQLHKWVTEADTAVGKSVGSFTGTAVTGLLGLVVCGYAALRVAKHKVDMRTLLATAGVPVTVTLIPGSVGTVLVAAVGVVPMVVGSVIGWAFGIG